MISEAALKKRLEQIVYEADPEVFIVEINFNVGPKSTLNIVVDTDEGVTLKTCSTISRKASFTLDEENLIDVPYTLEVTSPGLNRPLKLTRQYKKSIGRSLSIKLPDGNKIEGKLLEVDEKGILIEPPQVKKSKEGPVPQRINFDQIKEAKILVAFK